MAPTTKMIKVTSRGYVNTSRGKAFAPINRPYRESVDTIFRMLTVDRATIYEVLPNKELLKLTVHNFDKDNTPMPKTMVVEDPKKEEPVVEKEIPVEETPAPIIEPTDGGDEVAEDEIANEVPESDAEVESSMEVFEDEPVMKTVGQVEAPVSNPNGANQRMSKKERRRAARENRNNQGKPVSAVNPETV